MKLKAFTLAELLIALAILGVIATFTIPKVLTAQRNEAWNASTKETAAMIAGAFQAYKLDKSLTVNTNPGDLTPYMNYVSVDTSNSIDDTTNGSSLACFPLAPCLALHGGGKLKVQTFYTFGQTGNSNYIYFTFDPDGKYSGSTNGPGKSVSICLFYNGRITVGGPGGGTTYVSGGPVNYPDDAQASWWQSWN